MSKDTPKAWLTVAHADISQINPKLPNRDISDNLDVSFIPMKSVSALSGDVDLSESRSYGKVKKGYTPLIDDDVIFAKITPCMENGKSAHVANLRNGIGFASTEFHVSRLHSELPREFLFYYITQASFRRNAKRNMSGAAGQMRVSKKYFEQFDIPLPPLNEQKRIVAKIEELFSELDDGIESFKKAQQQLKTYRQAVLKYAFEGKLTEDWRKANKPEPASELLERIKEERQKHYEQQLEDWKKACEQAVANGEKKPSKPKKLSDLPPLDDEEKESFPPIPKSWCWVRIGSISYAVGGFAFKSKDFTQNGKFQVVKISNVKMGILDLSKSPSYIEDVPKDIISKYGITKGDCLITLTGTRKKRDYGFVAYVNDNMNILLNQRLALMRFYQPNNPLFFSYALRSEHFQNNFFKHETGNVGQGNVGMNAIVTETIAMPSPEEQLQIIEEIESRHSVCDQLEQSITDSLKRAEALKQSILKKAFEGKLVPQDPSDEPAEKLLERIKEEKQKWDKEKRKAGKRMRKKSN